MKGIWSLPVHLIGGSFSNSYALARIIIDIIFFVFIIFPWTRLTYNSNIKDQFRKIIYGAHILLLWFILNIVDQFLHEAKLKTGYGYILYQFFLSCARYATDIFMLAGTHRLISGQLNIQPSSQLRKKARTWYLTGKLIVLIQVILALYFLGSLFADEALWLQIADPSVIDGVASRKDKFEAAFFIIQFLLTLTMLTGAALSVWFWWREEKWIPSHAYLSAAMTSALWIRSMTELIIVIRYDYQNHSTLRNTYVARDTVYGFCSFAFLLFVDLLARDASNQDPRIITQAKIEEETRTFLLREAQNAIKAGQQPPDFRELVQTVRQNPDSALSNITKQQLGNMQRGDLDRLRELHEEYLERVEDRFGNLNAVDLTREF